MIKEIDWQAREVTIAEDGSFENTYSAGLSNASLKGAALTDLLISNFPSVLSGPFPPITDWKLIGASPAGKSDYSEPCIRITPEGPVPIMLMRYLGINPTLLTAIDHEAYSLKFKLNSHRIDLKVFKKDLPKIVLPKGCHFTRGCGLHVSITSLCEYREVYFSTTLSQQELEKAFNCAVPFIAFGEKYYCGLYDCRTKQVVKLKQIFYPHKATRKESRK